MADKTTQKKRVVSKGQYAEYLTRKMGITFTGGILFSISTLCVLSAVLFVGFVTYIAVSMPESRVSLNPWFFLNIAVGESVFLCMAWLTFWLGREALRTSRNIEAVVPLTQQTANQISPEDSLVRGSQQPSQQPETLLRAAQADETPPEQLLRAGVVAAPPATVED